LIYNLQLINYIVHVRYLPYNVEEKLSVELVTYNAVHGDGFILDVKMDSVQVGQFKIALKSIV